jgi:hypothetical protein
VVVASCRAATTGLLRAPASFSCRGRGAIIGEANADLGRCRGKLAFQNSDEHQAPSAAGTLARGYEGANLGRGKSWIRRQLVRPHHGSGWVRIVKDKAKLDRQELIRECNDWLGQSYYQLTGEWQYRNIKPRILIEEFIDDGSGNAAVDYKLMVHGKVHFTQVNRDRFNALKVTYYDRSWQRVDVVGLTDAIAPVIEDIPRPERLDEMIAAAEILAANIDFIRVDFYATQHAIYFGEFTVTPANGVVRYEPADFDYELGKLWEMKRAS